MSSYIFRSYAQAAVDVREWSRRLPSDISAVCGIPRSGTIIAAMLAEWRGIHMVELSELLAGARPWEAPHRRQIPAKTGGRVLLVDDTCWSGRTMRELEPSLQVIETPVLKSALYAGDKGRPFIDLWGRRLPIFQHSFEWNIGQDCLVRRACFDMDGVLCEDYSHPAEEGEWEPRYREHLANARPLRLPGYEIKAIVTGRMEKWRVETQNWLRRHGVRYQHLHMHPAQNDAERRKMGSVPHKAQHYQRYKDCWIFIESCARQARRIAEATARPVFCMDQMALYNGMDPDPWS